MLLLFLLFILSCCSLSFAEDTACLDCVDVCAILPPPGEEFPCYEGSPTNANLCYKTDPLIKAGSTYQCTHCNLIGYLYYLQNDPVYTEMELWGKNATSAAPSAIPTLAPTVLPTAIPTEKHDACLDCTTVCALLPPTGEEFPCYEGTPEDANHCFYTDPLIAPGSTFQCSNCSALGYPYYLQNDPVYVNMELWARNESSISPTPVPSAVPSAIPSALPSVTITAVPSAPPTRTPTGSPTPAPVLTVPTVSPSATPTISPSAQSSPIVKFQSSLVISGVSGTTLDTNSQAAVINVTASSMGISSDTVTYVGDAVVTSVSVNANKVNRNRKWSLQRRLTEGTTITATTEVNIPLSSTGYTNATLLYINLVEQLDSAVLSGDFTTQLVQISVLFNAMQTETANVTSVHCSPLVVDAFASDGDGSKHLDLGEKVALIAACVIVVFAMLFLVYHFVHKNNKKAVTEQPETAYPVDHRI